MANGFPLTVVNDTELFKPEMQFPISKETTAALKPNQ